MFAGCEETSTGASVALLRRPADASEPREIRSVGQAGASDSADDIRTPAHVAPTDAPIVRPGRVRHNPVPITGSLCEFCLRRRKCCADARSDPAADGGRPVGHPRRRPGDHRGPDVDRVRVVQLHNVWEMLSKAAYDACDFNVATRPCGRGCTIDAPAAGETTTTRVRTSLPPWTSRRYHWDRGAHNRSCRRSATRRRRRPSQRRRSQRGQGGRDEDESDGAAALSLSLPGGRRPLRGVGLGGTKVNLFEETHKQAYTKLLPVPVVVPRAARHAPLVPLEPREVIKIGAADDRRRPRERRRQVLHRRRALDADHQSRIREGEPVADRRRQREPVVKCGVLANQTLYLGGSMPSKYSAVTPGKARSLDSARGAFLPNSLRVRR